jgi:hypothetical protein
MREEEIWALLDSPGVQRQQQRRQRDMSQRCLDSRSMKKLSWRGGGQLEEISESQCSLSMGRRKIDTYRQIARLEKLEKEQIDPQPQTPQPAKP